jgi:23S rRNA (uridine2479-2'-O)-methyltransferase
MPSVHITKENDEYQIIQSLKTNREKRSKLHEVFIEGIEAFKQALAAKIRLTRIIIYDYDTLSDWAKNVIRENSEVLLIEMPFDMYRKLCDREEPVELLATAEKAEYTLENVSSAENPFVLIFDRPSDYGNFGSIIRSADAFGVSAVLVAGHGIDWYDPKAIRASLGAVFQKPVVQIQSMDELEQWMIRERTEHGMTVIGTDSSGSTSAAEYVLRKPVCIILGNEAKGMSIALQAFCDKIVSIPMCGDVNSLNVACAGTVFLWEVFKNSIR